MRLGVDYRYLFQAGHGSESARNQLPGVGSARVIMLELIGLIYDAAADPSQWQACLEAIVQRVGGRKATLAVQDSRHPEISYFCWTGWSDEDVRLYLEKYAERDEMACICATLPEGIAATDGDVMPRSDYEATAVFREFYGPRDGGHGTGGWTFRNPSTAPDPRPAAAASR
jgi:hypothetical protein